MNIRPANVSDVERIREIYGIAREKMKLSGNPSQWGDTYPPDDLLLDDLQKHRLYVVEDLSSFCEQTLPVGVFSFLPEGDPIYNNIVGKWLNDLPHSAIHRVASSGERRGILSACVGFCLTLSGNLKIDTHPDNLIMQRQLEKAGFSLCGTFNMPDGSPRLAYQLCSNSGKIGTNSISTKGTNEKCHKKQR